MKFPILPNLSHVSFPPIFKYFRVTFINRQIRKERFLNLITTAYNFVSVYLTYHISILVTCFLNLLFLLFITDQDACRPYVVSK
jgi:hypothetical protein